MTTIDTRPRGEAEFHDRGKFSRADTEFRECERNSLLDVLGTGALSGPCSSEDGWFLGGTEFDNRESIEGCDCEIGVVCVGSLVVVLFLVDSRGVSFSFLSFLLFLGSSGSTQDTH